MTTIRDAVVVLSRSTKRVTRQAIDDFRVVNRWSRLARRVKLVVAPVSRHRIDVFGVVLWVSRIAYRDKVFTTYEARFRGRELRITKVDRRRKESRWRDRDNEYAITEWRSPSLEVKFTKRETRPLCRE